METVDTQKTQETAGVEKKQTVSGRKGAAYFWAKFPNAEARSQYMKERWRKIHEKRAKRSVKTITRQNAEAEAALAIFELRKLLSDVLGLLDACHYNGHAGDVRNIIGESIASRVLCAATSLLHSGIQRSLRDRSEDKDDSQGK